MIIGKFRPEGNKLTGNIHTLSVCIACSFVPQENGADYAIRTAQTGCDLGAGWKKTSQNGVSYISVSLRSPFTEPVNCAMFQREDGSYHLVWEKQRTEA